MDRRLSFDYAAPPWLPSGHAQTIWAARLARAHAGKRPAFRRERWDTPDGDFIDVDFLSDHGPGSLSTAPLLVLFHGLEGSSGGHYSLAFADAARRRGWRYAVPHFRGCSGQPNRCPRAYHSGDFEEVGWILRRLRQQQAQPLLAVGISLGGNALLRWAQEAGPGAADLVRAVAAVSSPLDLAAAGAAIDVGLNQRIYGRMFLATMKPKALALLQRHPGLFDGARVRAARTLREFDDAFTAPLHGFEGVDDYWTRASAKPHLHRLQVPALLLNALNDPFVPAHSLPRAAEVAARVVLWQPAQGGHVGFPSGPPPGHLRAMPQAVLDWMQACPG